MKCLLFCGSCFAFLVKICKLKFSFRVSTEAKKNLKSEKFGRKKIILPAGFPSYTKWKMEPLLVLLSLARLKSGLDE